MMEKRKITPSPIESPLRLDIHEAQRRLIQTFNDGAKHDLTPTRRGLLQPRGRHAAPRPGITTPTRIIIVSGLAISALCTPSTALAVESSTPSVTPQVVQSNTDDLTTADPEITANATSTLTLTDTDKTPASTPEPMTTTSESSPAQPTTDPSPTPTDAPKATLPATGSWGTCQWEIDTNGVLTIHSGAGADVIINNQDKSIAPWNDYASQVTAIRTSGTVSFPKRSDHLFAKMTNLTDISGLSGIDVSYVESMHSMFSGCTSLEDLTPLSGWRLPKLTNLGYMFTGLPIKDLNALTDWRLPVANHLQAMFQDCHDLSDISATANWGLGDSVQGMGWMFRDCYALSDITPLASWKITNVTNTAGMFQSCPNITTTAPLKNWKTSHLINMSYMFYGLVGGSDGKRPFKLTDLSGLADWDVSHVNAMTDLFALQPQLKDLTPLASWKTTSVQGMRELFRGDTGIEDLTPLTNWDVSNVNDFGGTFQDCSSVKSLAPLAGWITSSAKCLDRTFQRCSSVTDLTPLKSWKTGNVTTMIYTFVGVSESTVEPLKSWDVSKVKYMNGTFMSNFYLTSLKGLEGWRPASLELMGDENASPGGTFASCVSLTDISAISGWDVSTVTSMRDLFFNCKKLSDITPLAGWKTTSLKRTDGTFLSTGITNVDALKNWDADQVWTTWGMFNGCDKLKNVDGLSNWVTSNLKHISIMFQGCSSLKNVYGLKNWNTSLVGSASRVFAGCSSLTDTSALSNWSLNSIILTNSSDMFNGCSSLELVGVPTPDHNGAWLLSEYTKATGSKGWTSFDWASVNRNLKSSQVRAGYTGVNPTITDVRVWRIGVKYWGTCPWWLDDAGTLHINDVPGQGVGADVVMKNSGLPTPEDAAQLPWWSVKEKVKAIATDGTVIMPEQSTCLFIWMRNLSDISGLAKWDASNVINMSNMFRMGSAMSDKMSSLENVDAMSGWDVSKVKSMDCMFWGNRSLKSIDGLSNWKTTSLTTTRWMFQGAVRLGSLKPLSGWDMSHVKTANCMFEGAIGLGSLDGLESWDMSSLESASGMFSAYGSPTDANPQSYGAPGKLADVSAVAHWSLDKVTNVAGMFAGSQLTDLNDLKDWRLPSCGLMGGMFSGSPLLEDTSAIASWTPDESAMDDQSAAGLAPAVNMFRDCPKIVRAGVPRIGAGAKWIAPEYPDLNWTDEGLPITPLKNADGIYPYMTSNDEGRVFTSEGGVFVPYQPVFIVTFDDNGATRPGDLPGRQWAYVTPTGDQSGAVDLPVGYKGAKTGYRFVGWSTSPVASTGVVDPSQATWRPDGGLSTGDPSKIVLYAVWEPNRTSELPSTGSHGLLESVMGALGVIGLVVATGRTRRPRHGRA